METGEQAKEVFSLQEELVTAVGVAATGEHGMIKGSYVSSFTTMKNRNFQSVFICRQYCLLVLFEAELRALKLCLCVILSIGREAGEEEYLLPFGVNLLSQQL